VEGDRIRKMNASWSSSGEPKYPDAGDPVTDNESLRLRVSGTKVVPRNYSSLHVYAGTFCFIGKESTHDRE
jgi:hypothetical protein